MPLCTTRQGFPPTTIEAAATGLTWQTAWEIDWREQTATDFTSTSTLDVNGVTFTRENADKCSTFEVNANGLEFVQDTNSIIVSGTSPALMATLSDLVTLTIHESLYVMYRLSIQADSGIAGVFLRESSEYLNAANRWAGSQHELYGFAGTSDYTDYSAATGSADVVVGALFTQGALRVFNHGTWSGSWPSSPESGTEVAVQGEKGSSGKSSTIFDLSSGTLEIGRICYRSTAPDPHYIFVQEKALVLREAA